MNGPREERGHDEAAESAAKNDQRGRAYVAAISARVVERQTREFEGLVVEIPCGFKSRPAHH